jgi:hypothetical protein
MSIKESSKKLYQANLKRLNDGKDIENYLFLKNTDKILEKINHLKDNTKRSYLISIVSTLKAEPKMKKAFDVYYAKMMEYNKNMQSNTTKSDTQNENWISQEDVKKIWENLKVDVGHLTKGKRKLDSADFEILSDFLILSLYVLIPPRRNDYLKMMIETPTEESSKDFNYLDLKHKKFIFNNFKTAGTYKQQVCDIPDELMEVIKLYLKFKKEKTGRFLVKPDQTPHDSINSITRVLNKIFKKKVGASMLRNIYLTDKYSKENGEKKKDAEAMGTSVNMIDTNYTKTD